MDARQECTLMLCFAAFHHPAAPETVILDDYVRKSIVKLDYRQSMFAKHLTPFPIC